MGTHLPGFQSFVSVFLYHFALAKLATHSIRVNLSFLLIILSLKNLSTVPQSKLWLDFCPDQSKYPILFTFCTLILMLLVANFDKLKKMQKSWKLTET